MPSTWRSSSPEAVELDFAQVSYIDSTGIGVPGAAHHAVDHGAEAAQCAPPVMRVVQLLVSTKRFRSPLHNLCPQKGVPFGICL